MICNYSIYNKRKKKNIELSLLWIPKEILQCKALSPLVYSSMVLDRNFSYNCNINKNCLAKVTHLNQEKERLKKKCMYHLSIVYSSFFLSFIERMYFSLTSREMRFLSNSSKHSTRYFQQLPCHMQLGKNKNVKSTQYKAISHAYIKFEK